MVALADEEVVGDPITVTINVLDINNNPPQFDQNIYTAAIRERTKQGGFLMNLDQNSEDVKALNKNYICFSGLVLLLKSYC